MSTVKIMAGRIRQATSGAAGFDLYSTETLTLWPGSRATIATGVRLEIPLGWCGLICDRSGLAKNKGVTRLGGLVDSDYRGEVKVVLQNHGEDPLTIAAGDRVAQIVFLPVSAAVVEDGGTVEYGGDRNGGFGSTGG